MKLSPDDKQVKLEFSEIEKLLPSKPNRKKLNVVEVNSNETGVFDNNESKKPVSNNDIASKKESSNPVVSVNSTFDKKEVTISKLECSPGILSKTVLSAPKNSFEWEKRWVSTNGDVAQISKLLEV